MVETNVGLSYPFDPSGRATTNRITQEQHTITSLNWRSYHYIVPSKGPYFEDSLQISYRDGTGQVVELIKGRDWNPAYWFVGASRACAKNVYGAIVFLNSNLAGNVEIAYNTLGGKWVLDQNQLGEVLAHSQYNPLATSWEVVANVPEVFPPVPHDWDLVDMVGAAELKETLRDIESAIRQRSGSTGTGSGNNGNGSTVTKQSIGLGNVQNYNVVPLAQAANATDNQSLVTPASARLLIANAVGSQFGTFILRKDNPHNVTAAQTGSYTKLEIERLLASKLDSSAVAEDSKRFAGRTDQQFREWVLSGTAHNTTMFNGRTWDDMVTQIQNYLRDSGTFGGYDPAQYRQWVLEGKAANTAKAFDKTEQEFLEWVHDNEKYGRDHIGEETIEEFFNRLKTNIAAELSAPSEELRREIDATIQRAVATRSIPEKDKAILLAEFSRTTAADANLVYGLDLAALKKEILLGESANAARFGEKSYAEAKADILSGVAANASMLNGETPDQFAARIKEDIAATLNAVTFANQTAEDWRNEIKNSSVDNATKLAGKTFEEVLEASRQSDAKTFVEQRVFTGRNPSSQLNGDGVAISPYLLASIDIGKMRAYPQTHSDLMFDIHGLITIPDVIQQYKDVVVKVIVSRDRLVANETQSPIKVTVVSEQVDYTRVPNFDLNRTLVSIKEQLNFRYEVTEEGKWNLYLVVNSSHRDFTIKYDSVDYDVVILEKDVLPKDIAITVIDPVYFEPRILIGGSENAVNLDAVDQNAWGKKVDDTVATKLKEDSSATAIVLLEKLQALQQEVYKHVDSVAASKTKMTEMENALSNISPALAKQAFGFDVLLPVSPNTDTASITCDMNFGTSFFVDIPADYTQNEVNLKFKGKKVPEAIDFNGPFSSNAKLPILQRGLIYLPSTTKVIHFEKDTGTKVYTDGIVPKNGAKMVVLEYTGILNQTAEHRKFTVLTFSKVADIIEADDVKLIKDIFAGKTLVYTGANYVTKGRI